MEKRDDNNAGPFAIPLRADYRVFDKNTQNLIEKLKKALISKPRPKSLSRQVVTPGIRVFFHGQRGTGKAFAASILGKHTGKDVYRIDLSEIVTKYIGETEKNLSALFENAENKDWILFFDEADALFGKRTSVRDAHDKYANQEILYLLQLIDSFRGPVIFSAGIKSAVPDEIIRRCSYEIHFPGSGSREKKL